MNDQASTKSHNDDQETPTMRCDDQANPTMLRDDEANQTAHPADQANPAAHRDNHEHEAFHHHHSHAAHTHHEHGHHVLQVEDLSIGFDMYKHATGFSGERVNSQVIDHLSLSVHAGEVLALVGASGSGKTLLADAIMGLYEPNVRVEGTIYFDGALQTAESLAKLRGGAIAFVPQSIAALDPLMRVGKQIGGTPEQRQRLYEHYKLPPEVERLYPHQLSGGMARRVLLCTALIGQPRLIVADEPTPGLDLDLAVAAMEDFRAFANDGGSVLLITHDIQLALRVADRIAVFKDGTVVEETGVESFSSPDTLATEFARDLWHALPEHDFAVTERKKR